ncbi:hypothetical protein C8R47DRAFT_1067310 [Mycena vitilis]|nr:hypothetical protein C8R47DRAFT_1067310 [Mycena vitilis]
MPPAIFNALGNILKSNKDETPETTRFMADKARANGFRYLCQDFENHPRQILFKLPTLAGQKTGVIPARDSNPQYTVGPGTGVVTIHLETGRNVQVESEAIPGCFAGGNSEIEGRAFTQQLEFGLRCVDPSTVTRTLVGANGETLMDQNPGAYRSPGCAWNIMGNAFDKLEDDVKHYIIGFILSGYYTYAVDQGIPQSAASPVPGLSSQSLCDVDLSAGMHSFGVVDLWPNCYVNTPTTSISSTTTTTMSMSGEPALPEDLEHLIFKTTALHLPQTMPVLLRVARRVCDWIKPMLYEVVVVCKHQDGSDERGIKLTESLRHAGPEFQWAKLVRHIWLQASSYRGPNSPIIDGYTLVALTTNLTNLTVIEEFCSPGLLHALRNTRLQRFSADLGRLFGDQPVDLGHPVFASVTHLHVQDPVVLDRPAWGRFSSARNLTHLAIYGAVYSADAGIRDDMIREIFRTRAGGKKLKVLALVWNSAPVQKGGDILPSPKINDHRLVPVEELHTQLEAWLRGAEDGTDFWSAAEKVADGRLAVQDER